MKKTFLVLLMLMMVGCEDIAPIKKVDSANPQVTASVIAVVDGKYKVYRVLPMGIYFVVVDNNIQTSWDQSCGDDCTETIRVQTLEAQR